MKRPPDRFAVGVERVGRRNEEVERQAGKGLRLTLPGWGSDQRSFCNQFNASKWPQKAAQSRFASGFLYSLCRPACTELRQKNLEHCRTRANAYGILLDTAFKVQSLLYRLRPRSTASPLIMKLMTAVPQRTPSQSILVL